MKNRKLVVVAFLLVSAMVLGVGYAALNDTLDITGSADVSQVAAEKEFEEKVYFTAAVANGDGTTNTASVNADNNDKASFSINTLAQKNDTASFTFTIVNTSDLNAVVTPALSANLGNTMPEYFEVTSDWSGAPRTISAGGTETYTVTVKLLKTPTETISGSFLIELKAVADEASNASN